ncbi:uncharacterized protein B0I36DRAFT_382898 [Microdochium trichocladiopsis]|uniref:Uncharacterized protein n=1 Tax=Microdochium trichocladiopsis TaxID=1682393 RepID=A0A9P8Y845_9PEZI|nr:uncharacterized protein B0I36DRAFT_382898 [Microdochium trichocladiopsis]KAH7032929.1 hypothetical protein B0I36DRAFT_382898 [Microdochium trichocladiopsis]
MFEIPDAKRVRREDLYESSAGGSSDGEDGARDVEMDAALRSKLNAQLADLLDVDFSVPGPASGGAAEAERKRGRQPRQQQSHEAGSDDDDDDDDHHEDETMSDGDRQRGEQDEDDDEPVEFAFRLFSGEDPAAHKVVLEKQDDAADAAGDGGGFVVSRRPASYYIAAEPSPDDRERYRAAAVSHEYLLADAGRSRWGIEKPWKVTTITITTKKTKDGKEKLMGTVAGNQPRTGRRTRPGKKRRIILRTREKAKKEKEVVAKQQAVDREQHLLEKKKRLNRQKKLKRRAKAKGQKKEGVDAGGEGDSDDEENGKSVASD